MNEELSKLTIDFYNELLRLDCNEKKWIQSTTFALEMMKIKRIEELIKILVDISSSIDNIDTSQDCSVTELHKIYEKIKYIS